ncbi:MAG: leucine-rich repeat protein [Clostridia bacterium]|nr:leucine-rich repeat protein [Clostridia bacterium]
MKKSLKRIISIILCAVMALGLFVTAPYAASADMVVSVDSASCLQGESVVATIYFPAEYDDAAAMDIKLNYDPAVLELVKFEKGAGLQSALDAQLNGKVYSEFSGAPGVVSWSLAGSNNYVFRGVFAVVTFNVRTTARNGETVLDLEIKDAANSGYVDITEQVTAQDAVIEIVRNTVNDFVFELNDDKSGYIIKAYQCATVDELVIPSEYKGLPVVGIADGVFRNHGELTKVVLPEYLETIGANAFQSCVNLTAIEIPDTVTSVGSYAFSLCTALESAKLSYGLEEVAESLFISCYSLKSVEIPFTVKKVGVNAFSNCISLSKVKISKNTTVGEAAFNKCASTGVEFTTVEGNTYLPELIATEYPKATIKLVEDISLGEITGVEDKYDYTGTPIEPAVKITLKNGKTVVEGTDYEVIFVNNIKTGDAKVYVPGIEGYGEGYVLGFEIFCAHDNVRKAVVQKSTCTSGGIIRYMCLDCGHTFEETTPALGHPSGEWIYDVRPTYDKTGLKHKVCAVCGESFEMDTVADKIYPDVVIDGKINSRDALAILQYSVGAEVYIEPEGLFNADTNGDGRINSVDALIVLKISVGAIAL